MVKDHYAMDPRMDVSRSVIAGALQYDVRLSKENFNFLLAGCPESGCLVGAASKGERILLFYDTVAGFPQSFQPMPQGDGYFAYMGLPVGNIAGLSPSQVEDMFSRAENTLESMINLSGAVPLVDKQERVFGYVVLRLEMGEE